MPASGEVTDRQDGDRHDGTRCVQAAWWASAGQAALRPPCRDIGRPSAGYFPVSGAVLDITPDTGNLLQCRGRNERGSLPSKCLIEQDCRLLTFLSR